MGTVPAHARWSTRIRSNNNNCSYYYYYTAALNHLEGTAASVSWKTLHQLFVGVVGLLIAVALHLSRDALYAPLNRHWAIETRRHHHDDCLRHAQHYVEQLQQRQQQEQHETNWNINNNNNNNVKAQQNQLALSQYDFSIVVITSQRKHAYLDVLMWSLLEGNNNHVSTTRTTPPPLSILNVERPPSNHRDLPKWQHLLLPQQQHESVSSQSQVRFINATSSEGNSKRSSWAVSGVLDYRDALNECIQHNQTTSWCIVLEEDVLLTRDFYAKFENTVVQPSARRRLRSQQRIAFVKLFVTDYYGGFGWDWSHLIDVAWMGVVSLVIVICLFLLVAPRNHYPTRCKDNTRTTKRHHPSVRRKFLVAFGLVWAAVYGACRLMGRQTLVNLFRQSQANLHLEAIGETDGAVGIAYPQYNIQELVDFITLRLEQRGSEVENSDVLLNRWVDEQEQTESETAPLTVLRTWPSLVQHMGAFSSASHKNQGNFETVKQDSTFVF